MKFAKHLDEAIVPEWSEKYFDYKAGKKLIKRCSQSRAELNQTSDEANGTLRPGFPTGHYGSLGYTDWSQASASSLGTANDSTRRVGQASMRCENRISFSYATQAEVTFHRFVEAQLDKIDAFYVEREQEAATRLETLKDQLQEMKERQNALRNVTAKGPTESPLRDYTKDRRPFFGRFYENIKSLLTFADQERLAKHPVKQGKRIDTVTQMTLTYRVAKRRLKLAFQEYYYSLELLQSYRSLNKQALRKIIKKFDKTVRAKVSADYIRIFNDERHIGKSDAIDTLQRESELVYAKHYCAGDRKAAAVSLRQKTRTEDDRFTMLRIGLYFGLAIPLLLEGLVRSLTSDRVSNAVIKNFLMQVWAGFFLLILMSILFGGACYIWQRNQINYPFIFEWQHNHHLNWTQYFEVPGLVLLEFSILFWMCFSDFYPNFQIWYPLVFFCSAILTLVTPVPFLHWSSRRWLVNANSRLLVSGLALVRFQDVYLGDVFTSLSYSVGNISLFFCLYRYNWTDPHQCGSSRSTLFGFFTALPGIFRFLQCLRRYADTQHWFPHLVNATKYLFTILTYLNLSLWRIHGLDHYKWLYVAFAISTTLFTTFWDINYDASLLQFHGKHTLLREHRAYKWVWFYYAFLFLDPFFRCSWIFHIIFQNDIQHAASLSFYIALAEVFRRACWSLFRVENEHIANVRLYRASRELPLPYALQDVIMSTISANRVTPETKQPAPKLADAHATDFSRAKSIRSAMESDSEDEDDA